MADAPKQEKSNKELLEALGVVLAPAKNVARSPRDERVIAGFEEIQRFVEEHGRRPVHGEGNDIFERLYATRLEQIQRQEDYRNLVMEFDYQGLLNDVDAVNEPSGGYNSDQELLAALGVTQKENDITHLKHVKPRAEVKAAEEVATRAPCADFATFKTLFDTVQQELKSGLREAKLLARQPEIETGDWFILQGQKAYIAKVGEEFINDNGHKEARLRVIFDNGTESNLFMRSLQKALKQDEAGRRIIEISHGPLFASASDEDDTASGIIYVLRSKSEHRTIAENRQLIHKIGVTGGSVKKRIANAKIDPTYLMADVEIVATYELFNISRTKLESLLHRFFDSSRLDIQISDRFGKPVVPREWFLVPLFIIDEVVERIKDGTLDKYSYDASKAQLVSD